MNAVVSKPKATILDLDALMDVKLSNVATLPDFMNPPPGIFMFTVKEVGTKKYKVKDPNTKKETGEEAHRINITYTIDETIQVADGEIGVPQGTLFSESFQATEQGLEFFKKRAMGVLNETDFGDASLGDIFSAMASVQFKARVTIRKADGYENVQLQIIREA